MTNRQPLIAGISASIWKISSILLLHPNILLKDVWTTAPDEGLAASGFTTPPALSIGLLLFGYCSTVSMLFQECGLLSVRLLQTKPRRLLERYISRSARPSVERTSSYTIVDR